MKKERYEVVGAKEYREQRGSEGLEEIKEGLDRYSVGETTERQLISW